MIELLAPVRLQVKTITSDNGKEFAQHKKVKQKLFSHFFFADAYASWRRRVGLRACLRVVTLDKSRGLEMLPMQASCVLIKV